MWSFGRLCPVCDHQIHRHLSTTLKSADPAVQHVDDKRWQEIRQARSNGSNDDVPMGRRYGYEHDDDCNASLVGGSASRFTCFTFRSSQVSTEVRGSLVKTLQKRGIQFSEARGWSCQVIQWNMCVEFQWVLGCFRLVTWHGIHMHACF